MIRLLSALLVLAFAATANAECVWMFWEEQEQNSFPEPIHTIWRVPLAYPSRAACVAVIEEYVKHWKPSPTQSVTRAGNSNFALIVRRHCLPDTVDPRGPKGK